MYLYRFLVDAGGNLYIDNVRLEDDGRWQCEAEDALGFVVTGRPIQLTVLGELFAHYVLVFLHTLLLCSLAVKVLGTC